jgi:hypothetical protein
MTDDGTIVVNEYLCSCFANTPNHNIAFAAYKLYKPILSKIFSEKKEGYHPLLNNLIKKKRKNLLYDDSLDTVQVINNEIE